MKSCCEKPVRGVSSTKKARTQTNERRIEISLRLALIGAIRQLLVFSCNRIVTFVTWRARHDVRFQPWFCSSLKPRATNCSNKMGILAPMFPFWNGAQVPLLCDAPRCQTATDVLRKTLTDK